MTTYKTGNHLGSAAAKGISDNAVNSGDEIWVDRLGTTRRTLVDIDRDANRAMLAYGYITKKSFELGNTLSNPNEVLLSESNGEYYRWDGSQPKVVPAGSTPESTGGVGDGAWKGVGDAVLRGNLKSSQDGMGDNLVTTKLPNLHAVSRSVREKLAELVSIRDFGALGDGVTDDSAAFLNAIAYVESQGGRLIIPAGHYVYDGSETIEIDLGIFSVESRGRAILDFKNFTGTIACRVYSSLTYPSAAYSNPTNRLKGVAFVGGLRDGTIGLYVGMLTTDKAYLGNIHIEDCSFDSFDIDIQMGHTSWRVRFDNVVTRYAKRYKYYAPSDIVDSGEDINFFGCMFADGGDILIEKNNYQVNMHSCSILNTKIHVHAVAALFRMYGGNVENPGAGSFYKYGVVDGSHTSRLDFIGTTIICNNFPLFTDTPFDVSTRNIITFNNVKLPASLNAIETNASHRKLVSGDGDVMLNACSLELNSGGVKFPVHDSCNKLHNAGFELGSTNGWTVNNSGNVAQTAVASTAAKRNGNYGLLATSASGYGIFINQRIQLTPGRQYIGSGWVKISTAASTGNAGAITITFYTQNDTQISSVSSAIPNSLGDYVINGGFLCGITPPGTYSVAVTLSALNGAVINFDDIIVNEV